MNNRKLGFWKSIGLLAALNASAVALPGCGKNDSSFSLLNQQNGFQQAQAVVNNKIDILWVIDNSGSMSPLQANLIRNYASFMTEFQNKGFDFQMAVTTSDAYLAHVDYRNDPNFALFKDGSGANHTGIRVVTDETPNALEVFKINANQGATGSGDERVFQSMLEALQNPINAGFLRPGAFLAVVILSDEDDFSNTTRPEGVGTDHDYNQAGLMQISTVKDTLSSLSASTETRRNYMVSAITVKDDACLIEHRKKAPSATLGTRYLQLAAETDGITGSVCDTEFASSLQFIQQKIAELVTQFRLETVPKVETIRVFVNGVELANDPVNGWTYHADTNSIQFHNAGVPPADASISIQYDPTGLK